MTVPADARAFSSPIRRIARLAREVLYCLGEEKSHGKHGR
jgi:hypothetical protein